MKIIHSFIILSFLVGCETVKTIDGPQTRERYKEFLSLYNETPYSEERFYSGNLRLHDNNFATPNFGTSSKLIKKAIQNEDWLNLSKLVYVTLSSGNLGYYYLGLSAEKLNNLDAAQKYYELALGAYHPYGNFVVPDCEIDNACNEINMPNDIYTSILRISNANPNVLLSKYLAVEETLVNWEGTLLNITEAMIAGMAAYGEAYSQSYANSDYSSSQRREPKMIFDSDGGYYNIIGNSIIGPNGDYYSINGNLITGPRGQTALITGNSIISSDGNIVTKAGNSYISSTGKTCTLTGSNIFCY